MAKNNGAGRANPARPGFPIVLDRPRRILFDLNALADLEAETGRNMLSPEGWAPFEAMDATSLRLLLWAGLRHEDPELTLAAAGGLIRQDNMAEIGAAIEAATTAGLPEPDPTPRTAKKKGRRRPGSSSGASAATTSA